MDLLNQGPGIVSRGSPFTQAPSPPSHMALAQSFPNSNHIERFKPSQQPVGFSTPKSVRNHQQTQVSRQFPICRSTSPLAEQPKQRSDLQGVVLTLGGPRTGGSQRQKRNFLLIRIFFLLPCKSQLICIKCPYASFSKMFTVIQPQELSSACVHLISRAPLLLPRVHVPSLYNFYLFSQSKIFTISFAKFHGRI